MSLVLCFSNLISSFKVCSFNLIFNSCSFCFWFWRSIFSCLTFSIFSSFNLLVSSFFNILYCPIVLAILSKKDWINFSIPKLILRLISGFKEFCKLINFKIKFCFFGFVDFITLLTFFIFFIFLYFNFDRNFLAFFLVWLILLKIFFLTFFLIFFYFFFIFLILKSLFLYQ